MWTVGTQGGLLTETAHFHPRWRVPLPSTLASLATTWWATGGGSVVLMDGGQEVYLCAEVCMYGVATVSFW